MAGITVTNEYVEYKTFNIRSLAKPEDDNPLAIENNTNNTNGNNEGEGEGEDEGEDDDGKDKQ